MTGDGVATALHELRGPLGAVRCGVELGLRLGTLSGGRLRALELEVGRTVRALEELEQVLAGVDGRVGGPQATHPGPALVELRPLLEDSVEAWRAAAGRRTVVLEPGRAGAAVAGERLRLAQATGNLLANAIEHGGGTVRVRVRASGGTARVEVCDEGPGLDAPLPELLGRGRHGLRVAATVAAEHGGRLLSGPSRRGARLVLELPLAPGSPAAAATVTAAATARRRDPPNVATPASEPGGCAGGVATGT